MARPIEPSAPDIVVPASSGRRMDPLAFAPGLLLNCATIAMTAIALVRGSERTDELGTIFPIAFGWGVFLLIWLARLLIAIAERTLESRDALRWLLAPILFAAVAVVFQEVFLEEQEEVRGYALGARLALSAGALDAAADAALHGSSVPKGWIGLYPVESVVVTRGAVRIGIAGQDALVRDAPPEEPSPIITYEPVFGRWSIEHDVSALD